MRLARAKNLTNQPKLSIPCDGCQLFAQKGMHSTMQTPLVGYLGWLLTMIISHRAAI